MKTKTKGSVIVQCTQPYFCLYEVGENGEPTGSGRTAILPNDAGVPLVPGLRYRITFEIVGAARNEKPKLCWYWPRWADPRQQRHAQNYFKSKREQRKWPDAHEHMRAVLKQAKESREQWKHDLAIWKATRKP